MLLAFWAKMEGRKRKKRKGVMPYGEDIRERETKDTQELDGDA